ncbi:MAG: uroporphyrinogen-III C-methyltransferase [Deltaproteobacteria bacterium]|jgi:uroporphyrinogen III methyltransferase/synthase|nr:uroporphyrinogen-III C-methyltransferase [Deltaproteobacteria bacterium]
MSDATAKRPGQVYLVGAGPGDPGLLTLRGAQVLARAHVVVHDHLAAPELLGLAPSESRKIYAGKVGSRHALRQHEINALLVSEALSGRTVVRLKGGDPYIFGRGGEEALELEKAGIPFEVVPGVTSAIAAASAAGIPLTHRDLASQVGIITGHERPGKEASAHDFGALARLGTLAAVMGVENLSGLCRSLVEAGKDPGTPAALIQWGATGRQRVAAATLGSLPGEAARAGLGAPALLVVGKVVGLRDRLCWFEKRPLFGKTVLVTRTREQSGRLAASLRELGANVLERPAIEIKPISPNPALDAALGALSGYRYLILSSPNGASIFMKALFGRGLDARALHGLLIAVIGPGTAGALADFGLAADIMPSRFVAEGLVEAFSGLPAGRALLARASEARDILVEGLRGLGFALDVVPLYETATADWAGLDPSGGEGGGLGDGDFLGGVDLATLTSASTARGLAEHVPADRRASLPVVSIGPVTSMAAIALGFKVAREARISTIEGLIEAARDFLAPVHP